MRKIEIITETRVTANPRRAGDGPGFTPNGVLNTARKIRIIRPMIHDIQITPTKSGWPYFSVELNGQKLQIISNDSNSPTGASGAMRQVFLSDEYVVKIGSIGESYLDIEEDDRRFFAEVVLADINKRWLVQRRIDCVPNQPTTDEDWEPVLELARHYNIGDVSFIAEYRGDTRQPHNWTVDVHGQPVIFDYDFISQNKPWYGFEDWQENECWHYDNSEDDEDLW